MTRAAVILSKALDLPDADRAMLARELALSLEDNFDDDAERLWIAEITRRSDSMRRRGSKPRDAFEAVNEIRANLRSKRGR